MKLKISIALLLALIPALASAKPKTPTAHMRPQLFRDRTPKFRAHEVRMHEVRERPQKSPPPPAAVSQDFE
jgi:hypothetical protein